MGDLRLEILAEARTYLEHQVTLGVVGVSVEPSVLLARSQKVLPDHLCHEMPARSQIRMMDQDRGAQLLAIRTELGDCKRCPLYVQRTSIVFGAGNPDARLMFVGEGPGRDEDLQGEPFVGEAGKLLDKMILAMGLHRRDVYIANVVKCRPPRNRDPASEEVTACQPFLKKQIAAVQPEVIVALGSYAAQTLLQDDTAISRMRGQWRTYEGIALLATFHPAYLLQNPVDKRLVWADLQIVMKRLGLEIDTSPKKRLDASRSSQ